MEYLNVRNWDKWQSYRKDRGQPPWIKVHRCVMRNPEWVSLSDSERGQLVLIWLLAADKNGLVPSSPSVIQRLCFMTKPPNINKFVELDFLTPGGCRDDAKMTPSGCRDDAPDKIRVEERREDKKETFCPNSVEFRLANLLLDEILKRKPTFKKPDIQKWSIHVERMVRIDKRDPKNIAKVIRWCQNDDFWQNNILSTDKLRKQLDQLELKMNKESTDSEGTYSDAYLALLKEEAQNANDV